MPEALLKLWNQPHWELRGRPDCVLFFCNILAAFPVATTLFVEGTSTAQDVDDFLSSAMEPGDYLPDRQTLWPRSKQYRLRFDSVNLAGLASLADRHASPELLDHLFVYNGSLALLEFPDAFGHHSPAFISTEADEQRIQGFAEVLGLELTRKGATGTH